VTRGQGDEVTRSRERGAGIREGASAAGFAFGVGAGPVLEFVGVEFAVEIGYALGEAGLCVGDGLVVNDGADFFEEEVEEEGGGRSPMGASMELRFSSK